jgi:hypothetical protein
MAATVREHPKRGDDARALPRRIHDTGIDPTPDLEAKTLTVHPHHPTQAARDAAVRYPCDELTATETIFPNTDLRPVYKPGSPQNSTTSGVRRAGSADWTACGAGAGLGFHGGGSRTGGDESREDARLGKLDSLRHERRAGVFERATRCSGPALRWCGWPLCRFPPRPVRGQCAVRDLLAGIGSSGRIVGRWSGYGIATIR